MQKNYSQKVYEDVFKDLLKVKNCKIINKIDQIIYISI